MFKEIGMVWPVFVLNKKKYILRARKDGQWEEVANFDRKVDSAEIRDQLDDLQASGYDYVALYEKTPKETKVIWSRKLRLAKKEKDAVDEISSSVNKILRVVEEVDKLRGRADVMEEVSRTVEMIGKLSEAFSKFFSSKGGGSGKPSIEDVVASLVYYDHLKNVLAQHVGKEENFTSFLTSLTNLVAQLKQSQAYLQQMQQAQQMAWTPPPPPPPAQQMTATTPPPPPPPPYQPPAQPQPQPTTQPSEGEVKIDEAKVLPVEGPIEEERALPEEIYEAREKAEEEIMPPCMKGEKCLEDQEEE